MRDATIILTLLASLASTASLAAGQAAPPDTSV
jgi:hypothetical protein